MSEQHMSSKVIVSSIDDVTKSFLKKKCPNDWFENNDNYHKIVEIINACKNENIDAFIKYFDKNTSLIFSNLFLDNNECIEFLDILIKITINENKNSMLIIQWFDQHGYNFNNNFTEYIDFAIENKSAGVLQWFEANKKLLFKNIDSSKLNNINSLDKIKWLISLNLEHLINNKILMYAAENNLIDILEFYDEKKQYVVTFMLPEMVLVASINGHISVLNFLLEHEYTIKCDTKIISAVSAKGHISVLQWFKDFGINFIYNDTAVNNAVKNGHVAILEWFKTSGFEFKYCKNILSIAAEYEQIDVLEWLKNSGFQIQFDCDDDDSDDSDDNYINIKHLKMMRETEHNKSNKNIINDAIINGHVSVIEWFKNSGLKFEYSKSAFNHAIKNANFSVLIWFKNSGLKLKYSNNGIKSAVVNGHLNVLQWFKFNELDYNYANICEDATEHNHIDILSWLKENDLLVMDKIEYHTISRIIENNYFDTLKFLLENGYKYDVHNLNYAIEYDRPEILKFLLKNTKLDWYFWEFSLDKYIKKSIDNKNSEITEILETLKQKRKQASNDALSTVGYMTLVVSMIAAGAYMIVDKISI